MLKSLSVIRHHPIHRRWFYPLVSCVIAFSLYLSSAYPTQALDWRNLIFRGIQVIQLTSMSDRQEVNLGKQIDQQLKRELRFDSNRATQQYISDIGQRLAAYSDRLNIPFTFQVVNDNNINAFATMGGFVYVNTGLIKAAENEAELASVIAHEIAHITSRHAVKQMRQMAIAQGVASAAGIDENIAVQIGVELALRRPHSRQAEYEADRLGLFMLGQAGYAQIAAVTFMEKLLRRGSPPTFLSTHPATGDRIAAMKNLMDPNRAYDGVGLDERAYQQTLTALFRR